MPWSDGTANKPHSRCRSTRHALPTVATCQIRIPIFYIGIIILLAAASWRFKNHTLTSCPSFCLSAVMASPSPSPKPPVADHLTASPCLNYAPARNAVNPTVSTNAQTPPVNPLKRPAEIQDLASPMSPSRKRPLPDAPQLRLPPTFATSGQLAFEALVRLPMPVIVLDSLKTVVLATEAIGKLLSLDPALDEFGNEATVLERLRGQTLSQVGIDVLQDGQSVWVTWDILLDSLADEFPTNHDSGTLLPQQRNTILDVVISPKNVAKSDLDIKPSTVKKKRLQQIHAMLTITVWQFEQAQKYFTLTFTQHGAKNTTTVLKKRGGSGSQLSEESTDCKAASLPSNVNASSVLTDRWPNSSVVDASSCAVSVSSTTFPPMAPPSVLSLHSSQIVLHKMTLMKDALLENLPTPGFAMWKDRSVAVPNKGKSGQQMFKCGWLQKYLLDVAASDMMETGTDPRDLVSISTAWF